MELISFTRYSFKDKANFQVEFLNNLVSQLEEDYNIVPIDNHIYDSFLRKNGHKIYKGILNPIRILL